MVADDRPEPTTDIGSPDAETLVVSEIFGPTVQGEGPTAGRRASFVRLGRCDLSCRWCDTPYTWDWDGITGRAYDPAVELDRRTVADVVAAVRAHGTERVVVTGGEPMLQRRALTALIRTLFVDGRAVEVETNGRHRPLDVPGVEYNVSPKLSSSGDEERRRIVPDALRAMGAEAAVFKFVVTGVDELDEVRRIVDLAEIGDDRVWISPQARSVAEVASVTAAVADAVIDRRWNLSTRLHVLAWGDERGR